MQCLWSNSYANRVALDAFYTKYVLQLVAVLGFFEYLSNLRGGESVMRNPFLCM
jgi:hypothetical protein